MGIQLGSGDRILSELKGILTVLPHYNHFFLREDGFSAPTCLLVLLISVTLGAKFRQATKPWFERTALIQCPYLTNTETGRGKQVVQDCTESGIFLYMYLYTHTYTKLFWEERIHWGCHGIILTTIESNNFTKLVIIMQHNGRVESRALVPGVSVVLLPATRGHEL